MTNAQKTEAAKSLQKELSRVARELERLRARRRKAQKTLAAIEEQIRTTSRTLRQLTEAAVAPELGDGGPELRAEGDGGGEYYCAACNVIHCSGETNYREHRFHATADRLPAGR